MKRILSLLVVLALVLSMVPSVFATTGTEEVPVDLTQDLVYEGDFSATVTIPAGTTGYYEAYRVGGMIMSINGVEQGVCTTEGVMMSYKWSIANTGAEAAEYVITVAFPVGSQNNPAELLTGMANYATIEQGSQGYFFNWTAPAAGTLRLEFYAEDANWSPLGWTYTVNNVTTGAYGDVQLSTSEPVVNPAELTVAAGDQIEIMVNTFDPADSWNAPAGSVSVTALFACAEHGETKVEDSYAGYHNVVCVACGTVVGMEDHVYVDDVCACEAIRPGTQANPHDLTNDLLYEGDYSATITVPAGVTYYCMAYRVNGMIMSINGVEQGICSVEGMFAPYTWELTNSGTEDATYVITVAFPVGSQNNPAELLTGMANYATVEQGGQGYFFTWTAPAAGALTLEFYAEDANWSPLGWTYAVNNLTTYVYGDTQTSASEPVVNPAELTVAAGDQIEIMVNTFDPADSWNAPAGSVSVTATFICTEHGETKVEDSYAGYHNVVCTLCGTVVNTEDHVYVDDVCACEAIRPGTQANPHDLTNDLLYEGDYSATITVPAGVTYYCMAYRVNGMIMSINGVEQGVCTTMGMFAPYTWELTNSGTEDATYVVTVAFPVGNMENPDTLVVGENTAQIQAGSMGYFYNWTAPAAGTLTITMPAGNWTYTVNNLTASAYGDSQYSNSDPLVNPAVITVAAGDEIELVVNTFDPEAPWDMPAGTLVITAAFQPDVVLNGWVQEGEKWAYYDNGTMLTNAWTKDSHDWVFLGTDGYMVTNAWAKDSHGWCYMGADGYMVKSKWVQDSIGWCYLDAEGYMVKSQWVKDSYDWCYVDGAGYMVTNAWAKDSKGWCYLGENGYMVKSKWVKDSIGWCYLDAQGYMVYSQWVKDAYGWCYVDDSGYMVYNQWVKDSKGWCFVGEEGYMVYNYVVLNTVTGDIYYIDVNGYMVADYWLGEGNDWLYFDSDGALVVSDWVRYNGNWYYMGDDGLMVYNTSLTIGGKTYQFNASGICTNP